MKFYRTEGPVPNYERTQLDAKNTGLSFGVVEVDTSHAGFTAFIKKVITETASICSKEPLLPLDEPEVDAPSPVTVACVKPGTQLWHPKTIESLTAGAVDDFIFAADTARLEKIKLTIIEAEADIAKRAAKAEAAINPPARKRTAA